MPQPVQQPRIPIWVGAGWPRQRPIERAARWDGIVPFGHDGSLTPADYCAMITTIQAHRHDDAPFDTVCYATTVAADGVVDDALIAEFAEAGVTWWLHGLGINLEQPLSEAIARVRQGPPRLR